MIDDSLHVQSGFTISCINLLGPEMKEGQALGKVLQLNERNAAHFQIMVEQVFEDFLPEEVSLSQIPRRLIIDDRAVKIEGSVVRSADKKVKNILFTIYDITEMEKIEQQNATNYCLIKILQQKDSFCQFVINTKENLEECLVPENRKEQNHLRSMLHSIKGNSSVFGMEDLAALIHQIEEKSSIDLLDVKLVEDHFKNFLGKHFEILNTFYESIAVETYTVSRSQVEKLENSFVTSIVSQQVKDEAFKWLDEIKLKPAKDYFNPFIKMGMSMAERLAKKVDVHLLTPEYLMDGDLLKPIVQNITHLIRNSIDHGIEPFHLRGAKNEKGFVAISVEKTKTHWIVRVTDDGRGVDIKTVCEVAVIKKLINPIDIEKMSDQKKLDLIFLSGVSTSSAVSQFSGRGIGMAAMFEAVKQVSGNIKIISEHGKGTTIVIFVPLKTNYLSDKKDALSSAS